MLQDGALRPILVAPFQLHACIAIMRRPKVICERVPYLTRPSVETLASSAFPHLYVWPS